jgi:hypothetical protein
VDLAGEFEENIRAEDASEHAEESEDNRNNSNLDAELGEDMTPPPPPGIPRITDVLLKSVVSFALVPSTVEYQPR